MTRRNGGRGGGRRGAGGGPPAPFVFNAALYGTLAWWLRGDDVTLNGADVSSWNDKSGNARHWTQATAALQPAQSVASQNGRNGLLFTASASECVAGPSLAAVTYAESFIVLKKAADPAAALASSSIWQVNGTLANAHNFTDGNTYLSFGSTTQQNCGNPTPALTSAHILDTWSVTNDWGAELNGSAFGSVLATNVTEAGSTTPFLGRDSSGVRFLDGTVWEWIVYTAKLSAGNRAAVITGLKTYYGIA